MPSSDDIHALSPPVQLTNTQHETNYRYHTPSPMRSITAHLLRLTPTMHCITLVLIVRYLYAVQSTIQQEIEVTVVKTGFVIGGHSDHTRRQHVVLFLTPYVLSGMPFFTGAYAYPDRHLAAAIHILCNRLSVFYSFFLLNFVRRK